MVRVITPDESSRCRTGPCSATPVACARARRCATGRSPRRTGFGCPPSDGPTVGLGAAAPMIRPGLARVRPLCLRLEGSPMACLCSKQLGSLLTTVSATLSTQALVPAMPSGLLRRHGRDLGTRSDGASVGVSRRDGCGVRASQPDREIGRDGELCSSSQGVDGRRCDDGAFGIGAGRVAGVADGERAVAECIGADAADRRTRARCSARCAGQPGDAARRCDRRACDLRHRPARARVPSPPCRARSMHPRRRRRAEWPRHRSDRQRVGGRIADGLDGLCGQRAGRRIGKRRRDGHVAPDARGPADHRELRCAVDAVGRGAACWPPSRVRSASI